MEKCLGEVSLFPASIKTAVSTKWGYINKKGQFVILPQLERAEDFQENRMAIVWIHGRAGVIDETGYFVIKPIYKGIFPFSEGLAIVSVDNQGMKVVNESGKVLTERAYPFISSFQEQRAVFQDCGPESLYGYLDSRGKVIIPAQYRYVHDFSDGKALVKRMDGSFALIDLYGEIIQTYPYEEMGMLSGGVLSFRKSYQDQAGYVNEEGKIMIGARFRSAMPFENERAIVTIEKENRYLYGLIKQTGEYVIPPIYHDLNLLGGDRASVGKAVDPENPFLGLVFAIADALTGEILTDFIYDSVNDFGGEYSSVTKGFYSFFIKHNGIPAMDLPIIQGIGTLSLEGDIIKAFVDERISYYDKSGHLIWS